MWRAMFVEQIPLAEKVLRTVLVYALIALLFRVAGKRGLANLNTFDFVVIFLLSNVVQNAVIGNDTSLTGGVVGAVTLVAVNAVVTRVVASNDSGRPPVRRARDHGDQRRARDRPGAAPSRDCGAANSTMRCALQNGDDVAEVQRGSLEPGGQLVLTLKHSEQGATKADIADVTARLSRIEELLGAAT